MQAVTRQIMGIGQELTYARERVALLDDAPKSNGNVAPSRVSGSLPRKRQRVQHMPVQRPLLHNFWLCMRPNL